MSAIHTACCYCNEKADDEDDIIELESIGRAHRECYKRIILKGREFLGDPEWCNVHVRSDWCWTEA